ncbi:MAG: AbrB/MazE/SpoVT family DNA-binding domain-containing protein [Candidatus Omnitrophica bacterium]|jgi:AbrB family looped-hinge helix DNA binding protein|nr:AbrB/MazE/SpoVT family DNA-binding domain-containing protein [Candidatus Omnitrophota bacterium]
MLTKIFNKGQVVIPAFLRKKYGLQIGEKVQIYEEKNRLVLVPVKEKDIRKIQGALSKYNKNKILTKKEIEKATVKEFTKKYI